MWLHLIYRYAGDTMTYRKDVPATIKGLTLAANSIPGQPELMNSWVDREEASAAPIIVPYTPANGVAIRRLLGDDIDY